MLNKLPSNILLPVYKKNQKEITQYIESFLNKKQIPFTNYKGNIISITHYKSPIFSAHLDTVDNSCFTFPLSYNPCTKILSRPNHILGADDRAGVNLILNHCEKINFVFTVGEESGGIGARNIIESYILEDLVEKYSIPCMVILDRKGNSDIIGSLNNYCEYDLDIAISDILNTYNIVRGVWCDADTFNVLLPCVNLSVGYYYQHTTSEYLNTDQFTNIDKQILKLNKSLTGKNFKSPYSFLSNNLHEVKQIEEDPIEYCKKFNCYTKEIEEYSNEYYKKCLDDIMKVHY